MSETILNCPFCGGRAEANGYDYAFYARCIGQECIASCHGLHYETQEEAIAAWNRRAAHADRDVVIDVTDDIVDRLMAIRDYQTRGSHITTVKEAIVEIRRLRTQAEADRRELAYMRDFLKGIAGQLTARATSPEQGQ